MTQDNSLTQKRQQIKAQINENKYKTLTEVMLDGLGYLVRKLIFSKKFFPFWYNAVVFVLFTFLVCILLALWLGGVSSAVSAETKFEISVSGLVGVLLGGIIAIAGAVTHRQLLKVLADVVVDAIEREADLDDLQKWLLNTSDLKAQFWTSLAPTLIMLPFAIYLRAIVTGESVGLGVYVVGIIAGFQAFTSLPVILESFALPKLQVAM
jgi:hypothetical protein